MKYSKEDVSKILTYYEYWRGHPDMTIEKAIDDYNPIESPTSTDTGQHDIYLVAEKLAEIKETFPAYSVMWGCNKGHKNHQTVLSIEGSQNDTCLKCGKHYEYGITPPTAHTEELSGMDLEEVTKVIEDLIKWIPDKHIAQKAIEKATEFINSLKK